VKQAAVERARADVPDISLANGLTMSSQLESIRDQYDHADSPNEGEASDRHEYERSYCTECGGLVSYVDAHGRCVRCRAESVPEKPRLIGTYGYEGDTTTTVQLLRDLQTAWRALGASADWTFVVKHREYADCAPDAIEVWVR